MIGSLPTRVDWGSKEFLYSCWHQVSRLHEQNMRPPNFIIDSAGHGKVIDFQSVVAADELCVYHGTIKTAPPYIWSHLIDQSVGKEKKVRVMSIDDAVSFILCVIMARFDLHRELTVAIRNGSDLQIVWTTSRITNKIVQSFIDVFGGGI
jgi:hypothetical protein